MVIGSRSTELQFYWSASFPKVLHIYAPDLFVPRPFHMVNSKPASSVKASYSILEVPVITSLNAEFSFLVLAELKVDDTHPGPRLNSANPIRQLPRICLQDCSTTVLRRTSPTCPRRCSLYGTQMTRPHRCPLSACCLYSASPTASSPTLCVLRHFHMPHKPHRLPIVSRGTGLP